jgi:predicted nucleic acid-binding protein
LKVKRKIVVSDAGPLIQLALSDHLYILPRLYDVVIPEEVFEETQYYSDLPDAIEIAKATRSWLKVKTVKNKNDVKHLLSQKLGKGEAQAIVLCREVRARYLVTSDKYAALKAETYGLKVMNIADVVREAYNAKIMNAQEVTALTDTFINQNILDTLYIRKLREEAKGWP